MVSDGICDALEALAGGSRAKKQAKRGAGIIGDVENFVGLGVRRQPRRAGIFDDIMDGVGRVADTVGSVGLVAIGSYFQAGAALSRCC